MTNAQHTRGPLIVNELSQRIHTEQDVTVARCEPHSTNMAKANARLLAAAYTSYDKHFGPNAIAAAEADLLGEALEAVREAWEMLPPIDPAHPNMGRYDRIRALLTKAGKAGQ